MLALSPGPIHSSFSGFTACIVEKLGTGYGEEPNYTGIMYHADKIFDFGNRSLCWLYYCMSYICKGGMNVVGYISFHNDSPHVSYDVIML